MGHSAHALALPERSRSRHRPESTVLYQTVAEHWPAFLERAGEHGGLPRFVVKEFEEYLRCGRLEHGCLHMVCRDCGYYALYDASTLDFRGVFEHFALVRLDAELGTVVWPNGADLDPMVLYAAITGRPAVSPADQRRAG